METLCLPLPSLIPLAAEVAFWTYNTRVVLLGTTLLGISAGVSGRSWCYASGPWSGT